MARIVTGALTTFNLSTHFDPQTLDLYGLRELISTPAHGAFASYTASNTRFTVEATTFALLIGTGAQLNSGYSHKLNVNGSIVAGDATSTNGTLVLQAYYGSGATATLGTERGSGAYAMIYGGTPSLAAGGAFLSSLAAAAPRSAMIVGDQIRFYIGASQTVAVGSPLTMPQIAVFDGFGNLLVNRSAQASGGKVEIAGNLVLQPSGGAPTLGVNGDMSFQLLSNTSLKILVSGSDGVTRSATLTLA